MFCQEVISIVGADFPFQLVSKKVDLPELQGEPEDIAKEKCRLAAKQVYHFHVNSYDYQCILFIGHITGFRTCYGGRHFSVL